MRMGLKNSEFLPKLYQKPNSLLCCQLVASYFQKTLNLSYVLIMEVFKILEDRGDFATNYGTLLCTDIKHAKQLSAFQYRLGCCDPAGWALSVFSVIPSVSYVRTCPR